MTAFPRCVNLGRSGLRVGKLGLGASYGAPAAAYREAFERGANYFYWGRLRRDGVGQAIREIAARDRDELVLVLQSYSGFAALLRRALRSGLRRLRLERADVLLLGWFNHRPSTRPAATGAGVSIP